MEAERTGKGPGMRSPCTGVGGVKSFLDRGPFHDARPFRRLCGSHGRYLTASCMRAQAVRDAKVTTGFEGVTW